MLEGWHISAAFARFKKGTTLFPLFQVINPTFLLVPFLKTEKLGLPAAPNLLDSLMDTTYASPALLPLLLGDWRISAAFYTIQKGHSPFPFVSSHKSNYFTCALFENREAGSSRIVLPLRLAS